MANRYELVKDAIKEGGFGKVEKAMDLELERHVAIKTLDPLFKSGASPHDIERFKREAKTLASLSHPNIPAIYDVVFSEENNSFKIIFEWIEGNTARNFLNNTGVMSLEQIRRWFSKVCAALEHAHNRGVIHRDIKPSNLIITEDEWSCYLVDFGIALRTSDLQRLTDNTAIGTPGYMSPEQERGEELDRSTDIWSLAIVLYECLTENRPTVGEYNPLSDFNATIPPAIDELIRDCLTDKESRLSSAEEFVERLIAALRPPASFSRILSSGQLYEIERALIGMQSDDYSSLPVGQKILIMSRIKDMVRVDEFKVRNALASLIAQLVRVGFRSTEKDYSFIVKNGLEYGFSIKYGDRWIGKPEIREALVNAAIACPQSTHKVLSDNLLEFINNRDDLENKEHWFYHDMRTIIQNLLANSCCLDANAVSLGECLDKINEISHHSHKDQEENLNN